MKLEVSGLVCSQSVCSVCVRACVSVYICKYERETGPDCVLHKSGEFDPCSGFSQDSEEAFFGPKMLQPPLTLLFRHQPGD